MPSRFFGEIRTIHHHWTVLEASTTFLVIKMLLGRGGGGKPLSTALSSAINKSQQHQRKNIGNAENQTWGSRLRSKCATSVLW